MYTVKIESWSVSTRRRTLVIPDSIPHYARRSRSSWRSRSFTLQYSFMFTVFLIWIVLLLENACVHTMSLANRVNRIATTHHSCSLLIKQITSRRTSWQTTPKTKIIPKHFFNACRNNLMFCINENQYSVTLESRKSRAITSPSVCGFVFASALPRRVCASV